MARTARILIVTAAAALSAACADRISSNSLDATSLDAAFISTPLGFESASSSFSGTGSVGTAFVPEADQEHHDRGKNELRLGFDFMGGGFGPDFLGGPAIGRPFDHDRDRDHDDGLGPNCSFSAATGLVSCTVTRGGLTFASTEAFSTAAGVAQSAPDNTTDKVVTHSTITGTVTRRDGRVTTTVNHVSDRTVTGLAAGSTQRTVNGTSGGTESTTGTDSANAFTAMRTIGDTVTGVIVPVANGRPSFPTAGTVIRAMQATLTEAGKSPVTSSRREVITFDGSATAKLVITQDGVTKTCTIALPHGRPVCQ